MAEDILIGGYRLRNLLHTGQTSQVWEAIELSSNRHFAMKLLLPERVSDPVQRRLLIHEAEVGKELRHPNVVRIMSLSRSPKNPYYIMEYFQAGSLKMRLMKIQRRERDFNKEQEFIKERAASIFQQAATALAYMHGNGWVHRDVKPDNMMVNGAGELRLIDFALARRLQTGPGLLRRLFRRGGKVQGTMSYMSPEQIRNEWIDGRADIYSYGITAYELVTGRTPFRGATAQELLGKHIAEKPVSPTVHNPDVTDKFAGLVLRMLAKKREDRPKDFHEVLMALRGTPIFKSQPLRKPAESE